MDILTKLDMAREIHPCLFFSVVASNTSWPENTGDTVCVAEVPDIMDTTQCHGFAFVRFII